jgi:membrane associated rhomboid family serine protease
MILGEEASLINTPWTTIMLAMIWVAAFAGWMFQPDAMHYILAMGFGYVPANLLHATAPFPHEPHAPFLLTPFTATFLQHDLFELMGNVFFLWVCGRHVEDSFGRRAYLIFLVAAVLLITIVDLIVFPHATQLRQGASGMVAAAIGCYLVLFPKARFKALLYVWTRGWYTFRIPAWLALGLWIAVILALDWTGADGPLGASFVAELAGFLGGIAIGFAMAHYGFAATFEKLAEPPPEPATTGAQGRATK